MTYYRWVFRGRIEGQITGETSPTYSWVQRYPEAPRRIAADAPGIPLIFMIRDPVERLLSHYRHRLLLVRQSGGAAEEIAPALSEQSGPQSRRTLSTSTPDSCSWSTWTTCSRAANHSCGSSTISACRDRANGAELPAIYLDSEELRLRYPERCADLDEQYAWVRQRFIDGPGAGQPPSDTASPESSK